MWGSIFHLRDNAIYYSLILITSAYEGIEHRIFIHLKARVDSNCKIYVLKQHLKSHRSNFSDPLTQNIEGPT